MSPDPTRSIASIFVSCAGLMGAIDVMAADVPQPAVGVHIGSLHSQPGFESRNFGVSHRWSNGVTIGAFNNSYGQVSTYAGWLWNLDAAGRFGLFIGAATGYGNTEESLPLAPIVAPTTRWRFDDRWAVRLSWFADPRAGAAQVLHLSVERSY